MTTRTIKSHTAEFPTSRDLITAILAKLVQKEDGWAHIERVKKQGWLKHLLSDGYRPYVEVALYQGGFALNATGVRVANAAESLGRLWQEHDDKWQIPSSDQTRLVDWTVENLGSTSTEEFYLTAYIDGL